jgi:malate dehydrogenase (oxaloacetate-decarboxylating)(NADP+)
MQPVFDQAKQAPQRVVFADGEEGTALQAVQEVLDEGIALPIVIGREEAVRAKMSELGLRFDLGGEVRLVDPHSNPDCEAHCREYHALMGRAGISPGEAEKIVRTQSTVLAMLLLRAGEADAAICGMVGPFNAHLKHVYNVVGKEPGVHELSTVTALVLPSGTFFLCDTHVSADPSAQDIAEMTLLAARSVRRFGIKPTVALLSHSNFGSHDDTSARKMREALRMIRERDPQLDVEGEMHADAALSEEIRNRVFPGSRIRGQANLLITPNMDAANIAYSLLRMLGGGVAVGPILIGSAQPVHIASGSATARGIVNLTALAVVEAQAAAAASRAPDAT